MGTALVTGASKGIGAEVCRQLSELGWSVYRTCKEGGEGIIKMDVTVPQDVWDVREILLKEGVLSLDLLVNNAGIFPNKEDILNCDLLDLAECIRVNAIGPLFVAQKLWPFLRGGRIINISSVLSLTTKPDATRAAYSISKSMLNHVTRMLSLAGVEPNISVNAICPGHCRTDMGKDHAPQSVEEATEKIIWLATEVPHDISGKFFLGNEMAHW